MPNHDEGQRGFSVRPEMDDTTVSAGTSLVITEPAETTALVPTVTPGPTKDAAPTHAPSFTMIASFRYAMSSLR